MPLGRLFYALWRVRLYHRGARLSRSLSGAAHVSKWCPFCVTGLHVGWGRGSYSSRTPRANFVMLNHRLFETDSCPRMRVDVGTVCYCLPGNE